MTDILKWYLITAVLGAVGLPFCFRLMKALPGKGFAFARTFGFLLVSYLYWLGCTLGLLTNNTGSLLLILAVAAVIAGRIALQDRTELLTWLKKNRYYCLAVELVYLLGFALIVVFRLAGPEVSGTEKPMEMMFINSILQSDSFPPHDSWLSGYGISYYYFGYIMSAVLILLSGTASAVGFNLMLATVFGLAGCGAFALVNDMLNAKQTPDENVLNTRIAAFLAPVFVLVAGNLEGLFETLHSLRLFWSPDGTSSFWTWLGLQELSSAPTRPATWNITGRSGIWWWRGSRVLTDFSLDGGSKEVIDEFPMFSFELGDLHPHVLNIPFVIFAAALALNAFLLLMKKKDRGPFFIQGILDGDCSLKDTALVRSILSPQFWFTALGIGAPIFINTWDFPFYFGLYCLAVTAAYLHHHGWDRSVITVLFEEAFPLGIASLLLYGLFLISLSTQAGGVAPSGLFVTRPIHFFIMFGLFILPTLWWLLRKCRDCSGAPVRFGIRCGGLLFAGLTLIEIVMVCLLLLSFVRGSGGPLGAAASAFCSIQGISDAASGLKTFFSRRLGSILTPVVLFVMAGGVFALLSAFDPNVREQKDSLHETDIFCGLMILIGAALAVFPEFFYLRDFFGTRMNTIFKFYYQAWILLGLSAAYCCAELPKLLSRPSRWIFRAAVTLLFISAMIYPGWCISGKIASLNKNSSLEGDGWLRRSRPGDWAGIEWLKNEPMGVVLEKVGSSYSSDNSASVFSGYPTVQGPANHESQWRGGYAEMGSRAADVQKIYESRSWETAEELLNLYNVRYIFIGTSERDSYNVQDAKFEAHLPLVFEENGCKIYRVY